MTAPYPWRSAEAARQAKVSLDELVSASGELEGPLAGTTASALKLGGVLKVASTLYTDFRLMHGQAMWLRRVDFYNKWQVFTEGHQAVVRVAVSLAETLLNEGLAEALPATVKLRGPATITLLQPEPTKAAARDLLRIEAPVSVVESGASFGARLTLLGYLSFIRDKAGSLVLVRAPSLIFDKPPPFEIGSLSRDIEKAVVAARWLDRAWLSQLGPVEAIGVQANRDICLFGRVTEPPDQGGPQFLALSPAPYFDPLPSGFSLAVVIPSSAYSQAIQPPDGVGEHTRGRVRNPWGEGADWVYDFGLQYSRPMTVTINAGSFGRFNYSITPSYTYFHLCFDAQVRQGVGELIATTRMASNGKVVTSTVIRQFPGVSAARVLMNEQGEVTFAYNKA